MLDILWLILIIYIVLLGIYYSFKIHFKNYQIKGLFKKINKDSLFLALGTKMGVGTIIGTTMSIHIGGPGSILWIYFFSILTSSIIFVESFLGSKYKQKINNEYIGGIYYYTKYGLNKGSLALIALVLFISTYTFFFLMIQTNTIYNTLKINKYVLGSIVFIFITIIISKDVTKIRTLLNKIVPFMCIFFICISLFVIIKNYNLLGNIIHDIITDAFNLASFLPGMIIGIKRSIFLNELLIGTTSMSSGINNKNSEETANTLVLGSYFITFIISTLVSLLVLIYFKSENVISSSYIELLLKTFTYHFGNLGNTFLIIIICSLSISTIISGIYIGISNFEFLFNNKKLLLIFKALITIFITSGIFISTNNIWLLIDIMMLALIIVNSYVITKLRSSI